MSPIWDIFSSKPKEELNTVQRNKLEQLLNDVNLLTEIKNGTVDCEICGEEISITNFGAMKPVEGDIIIACDNIYCINEVSNK